MGRPQAAMPLIVGLALTIGILGSTAVASLVPSKTELLTSPNGITGPLWEWYASPGHLQVGGTDTCITGSHFGPQCIEANLPGNSSPNVTGEAYVYQHVHPPTDVSQYMLELSSFGLAGMTGVGNGLVLVLCSTSDQGCEGTPDQLLRFELFRCVQGDARCSANHDVGMAPYRARLVLSTNGGSTVKISETGVENLTLANISGVRVQAYGYAHYYSSGIDIGQDAVAQFGISYRFQDQIFQNWTTGTVGHTLSLYGVSYDISRVDGVKVGFASGCAICDGMNQASYAKVDSVSYTVTAPASSYLHLNTISGGTIFTGLAAAPAIAGLLYYVRRRRQSQQPNVSKVKMTLLWTS